MGRRPPYASLCCCVHGQIPHCPHAHFALRLGSALALQAGKLSMELLALLAVQAQLLQDSDGPLSPKGEY